jgi:pimeloyl-ACP methyl ester carboxylesterase
VKQSWGWLFFLAWGTACAFSSAELPERADSFHRLPIRTVEVRGVRLAYLDVGQGAPLILLHGLGGSMWQWEYQQLPLSASHRVLTLDQVGSGLSDKPAIDYSPTDMVEFVKGFMDAVKLERASFVGQSMGAGVAIGMALTYPERVDRLVLISGFPDHIRENLSSELLKDALDTWAPVWLAQFANWISGRGPTTRVLEEVVYDRSLLTPEIIERSYRNRKRQGIIPPLFGLMRSLPLWESGFAARFGEIHQPTLVLWGTEDRVFLPRVGENLAGKIPGARFVLIPRTSHLPQWESPDLVNELILDFVRP